jgi:hypothetical protein
MHVCSDVTSYLEKSGLRMSKATRRHERSYFAPRHAIAMSKHCCKQSALSVQADLDQLDSLRVVHYYDTIHVRRLDPSFALAWRPTNGQGRFQGESGWQAPSDPAFLPNIGTSACYFINHARKSRSHDLDPTASRFKAA